MQDLSTTEDGSYYLNGAVTDAALMAVTRKNNATWVIPTEDEWYKAAYHKNDGATGNYWEYPTASNSPPGRNMSETTNAGNNANYLGSPFPIDSGKYYTTVAGAFQMSVSPYGTFDQGGNVWECNETNVYDMRGLRGGAFNDDRTGDLRALARYNSTPRDEGYGAGFRVASVPEPGSITLLLAGGALSLLAYAWRRRKRALAAWTSSLNVGQQARRQRCST